MASSQTNYGGISFFGLLQIVFIVLKLIDRIDWSWWWVLAPMWWVLAPMWISLAIVGVFVVFCLVMALIFNRGRTNRW